MGLRINPHYGTFLPVLSRCLALTNGPVLELGMGLFSTLYLHWACFPDKRPLVSFESDPAYFAWFARFETDYHNLYLVQDWDQAGIERPWDVALVDHAPAERRVVEAERLRRFTKYIVCHDTSWKMDRHYGYSRLLPTFRYRYEYDATKPTTTTVVSDLVDLRDFHA